MLKGTASDVFKVSRFHPIRTFLFVNVLFKSSLHRVFWLSCRSWRIQLVQMVELRLWTSSCQNFLVLWLKPLNSLLIFFLKFRQIFVENLVMKFLLILLALKSLVDAAFCLLNSVPLLEISWSCLYCPRFEIIELFLYQTEFVLLHRHEDLLVFLKFPLGQLLKLGSFHKVLRFGPLKRIELLPDASCVAVSFLLSYSFSLDN
jgi:hypothetical protein